MAEIKQVGQLPTKPGVRRDGTMLDGDYFSEAQWVRFQRGRAKKMGGTKRIADSLVGPIRSTLVWSRASFNAIFTFSRSAIEMLLVDENGNGAGVTDRSPVTPDPGVITASDELMWSVAAQYDDAVGSAGTVILAHPSHSLSNIDNTTAFKPLLGLAADSSTFTQITGAPSVSGGVFSVAPYSIAHGSDGYIAWSNINEPQTWDSGDAGADRVTATKIVKGLPLRSGAGPAALLWSLDSVLRMDYTGGQSIFRFSHLSTQTSILSQNSVIEYDGMYYWLGIDRFLVSDGSRIQELPNQMNINWVFDNMNYARRQTVWAMKTPRYGEICWFFPYGDAQECTRSVIYNTREQTWYDNALERSSGFPSQVFRYPVMTDATPIPARSKIRVSTLTGLSVGDRLSGASSGASGTILRTYGASPYYCDVLLSTDTEFLDGETVTDVDSAATVTITTSQDVYGAHIHEFGTDCIAGDSVSAIDSYVITSDFGLPTSTGMNRWTRLTRIEPDFVQTGDMEVTVIGREFANASDVESAPYVFSPDTDRIDCREQRREIRLKFRSNVEGGHFEAGKVLIHTEPGDVRS